MSVLRGASIRWIIFPPFLVYLPIEIKMLVLVGLIVFFFIVSFILLTLKVLLNVNYSVSQVYYGGIWFIPYLSTLLIMPLLTIGKYIIKNFDQT